MAGGAAAGSGMAGAAVGETAAAAAGRAIPAAASSGYGTVAGEVARGSAQSTGSSLKNLAQDQFQNFVQNGGSMGGGGKGEEKPPPNVPLFGADNGGNFNGVNGDYGQ